MNYYKRFPGDYLRDTAHLSLAEHGAYTVLLDTYYSTESPLPDDEGALYRICRAMTKEEKQAVMYVANKFFSVRIDGFRHNDRADSEIEAAQPKIEAAKKNGKKGGRPRKANLPITESETETDTNTKPNGFSSGIPTESNAGVHQRQSKPIPSHKDEIGGDHRPLIEVDPATGEILGRAS